MPSSTRSDRLTVFLSGTFSDMGPEREHLLKKIFPELRQICRERGVTLSEIDLRWGITERQARQGKIVTACLDEILHRRPYMLVLVGDRYGWRPGPNDLNDARLERQFPWIARSVAQGKSLVELETLETAKHEPEMKDRMRFYFKHRKDVPSKKRGSKDAEEKRLLKAFRRRVKESGVHLREGYHNPEQLGEWVRQDVLTILESIAPIEADGESWIVRERFGHEAYAATRRRAYVDHEPTLKKLDKHVEPVSSDNRERSRPLVITGDSGSGKSALLARWTRLYRAKHPNAFVIEHYTGSTPSSVDRFALMRRIMVEIRDRYNLDDELPALPDQIVTEFPAWLARLRNEPLVLVIDALDRFGDPEQTVRSLPADYPSEVRVLCSTLPSLIDVIQDKGWKTFKIPPLGARNRKRAIRAYLAEFSKGLEPEQIRRIAADGKNANPLYLRTSLEELRLHGQHETLNRRINHYLSATDPEDLFRLVLERVENDFGKGLTTSVMSLLWASRNGLTETELATITEVPSDKLRQLTRGMEYHFTLIDGRVNFCHEHLRTAVRKRYTGSRVRQRNLHRKIGSWFAQQPVSQRRAEEEPWQWKQAEEWGRLQDCLTDAEMFLELCSAEGQYILLEYWRYFDQSVDVGKLYYYTGERAERQKPGGESVAILWKQIGEFLRLSARYEDAIRAFQRGLHCVDGSHNIDLESALMVNLGGCQTEAGKFDEAERTLRQGLVLLRNQEVLNEMGIADTLEQLGRLYYDLKRFDDAVPLLKEALDIRKNQLGSDHALTGKTSGSLAASLSALREFDKAQKLFRFELAVLEQHYGVRHPYVATCLSNLGTIAANNKDFVTGADLLKRACDIYEDVYGPMHPITATGLTNLSYIMRRMEKVKEAEEFLRRAIGIDRHTYGDRHPALAQKLTNLGTLLKDSGKAKSAELPYQEALSIRQEFFGPEHINTITAWLNLASSYKEQGRIDEALWLYEAYLPQKKSILGDAHPDVQLSKSQFEELLVQRDSEENRSVPALL